MTKSAHLTKQKILQSAKAEFMANGFMNASLRTIASNAGVTTGAMYRHFQDKDALFCALVDNAIEAAQKAVSTASAETHILQGEDPVSPEHNEHEHQIIEKLLNYIYSDFDAFTLLLTKSAGSTHENFLDELCELYTKNCMETLTWMHDTNIAPKSVDYMTVHVIASSFVNAFAEIILHNMKKDDALKFITNIEEFFHFGTMHMMGVPCAPEK